MKGIHNMSKETIHIYMYVWSCMILTSNVLFSFMTNFNIINEISYE